MFGKKKEQKIETGGVTYRRAKTWQIALASCSSGNWNELLCTAWSCKLCCK